LFLAYNANLKKDDVSLFIHSICGKVVGNWPEK
jgi:hypothetical protein